VALTPLLTILYLTSCILGRALSEPTVELDVHFQWVTLTHGVSLLGGGGPEYLGKGSRSRPQHCFEVGKVDLLSPQGGLT
jgi:hypothetical protein